MLAELAPIPFLIIYTNAAEEPMHSEVVMAQCHWDACSHGLDRMHQIGADDFDCVEEQAAQAL